MVALATCGSGCKGALGQVAGATAVAAITAVQIAAMKPRRGAEPSYAAAPPASPGPSGISPCGRCAEPENGYAVCFVSTCEVRCIDGYVLDADRCVPVGAPRDGT